ncbi:SNF2-related protein [Pseudomonas putida]|uniref:SNF2-related protein n=1 Tax=Pseudomonas putida TaxID=303 RepID=UPI002159F205|nr:SNF2-related protein [Pseudomonas putida]
MKQRSLFEDESSSFDGNLPSQSRMPLNEAGKDVHSVLFSDICNRWDSLVVTGYSGLEQLVQLVTARGEQPTPLRIILGSEPFVVRNPRFNLKNNDFSAEVRSYWLEHGISLILCGQVLRCIELIRAGCVRVRYSTGIRRLHAKVYSAAGAVTLGSSNFTAPGLHNQHEANVRFTSGDKARFEEARSVAECFWSQGKDAEDEFIALLQQLLKFVTWQEALSRACAELLESEWASHYLQSLMELDPHELWPSQRQGIGQALYLLDTVGAVLVADATGSGKTRLGAHLLRAINDRNWSSARARKGGMLLICPPLVKANWDRETTKCSFNIAIASHGLLSRLSERDNSILGMRLSSAQTLAVDEAHNFLNQMSKRTRFLKHHLADQVALFTATPINRTRADLLRLIDILGADNFDDEVLAVFERLNKRGAGVGDFHVHDLEALRIGIGSFTMRRTKSQLNAMVDLDPEAYRLPGGRVCRYPKQLSTSYPLDESRSDRKLAKEIRQLALQLKGVTHFQKPLILSENLRESGITPESYLDFRLDAASSSALFQVMSSLRSSRLALFRHIEGTRNACRRMGLNTEGIKGRDDETGNMLERITRLGGKVPENHLGISLPSWLTDNEEHRRACEAECAVYQEILSRLEKMSGKREERKVDLLLGLLDRHQQILAFDHYPLTLRYLEHLIAIRPAPKKAFQVVLGVGGSRRSHEHIQALLSPEGESVGRLIVLCSDALSEGVNLQRASTLVHLDMPSVVRIAEQRVGRIDRMDTRHTEIESWWPKDSVEFALRSDETFLRRVDEVDSLIGGNLLLPEDLRTPLKVRIVTREELEAEMKARESMYWDGIEDAFAPIRALVSGENALVEAATYEQYRAETSKVLSRVTVVRALKPWVFICLRGERARAPRWVLIPGLNEQPIIELRAIANQLRARLTEEVQNLDPSRSAMGELQKFLTGLGDVEKLLLPKRKQRALVQFHWAVQLWVRDKEWVSSADQADQVNQLLELFEADASELSPDWGQLADIWLELLRPRSAELPPKKGRRAAMVRLRDLEPGLKSQPIPLEVLLKKLSGVDLRRRWEERIVACILGHGATGSD